MEPLDYLNKIMDVGVEYDKEISLGTMMSPQGAIDISTKISTSLESSTGKIYNIKVDIGNDVVEFTKEHSNILAGAVILVLAGALVVNAIPSIIALFSAGAGTVFGLLIQAL